MQIKKFDPTLLSDLCSINLVMGGFDHKFAIIKYILQIKQNHPTKLVIEQHEKINQVFYGLIDDRLIYNEYFPIILKNIFSRNKKMLEKNLDSKLLFITYHSLNYKLYNEEMIMELSTNYKSNNISWLDVDHFVKPKPQYIYQSFDWIIFGSEYTISNLKIIYNRYFLFIKTFEEFWELFSNLTENYNVIVFDNKNQPENPYDKIFTLDYDTVYKYAIKYKKYLY
jgi:hypothetical protein